MEPTLTPLPDTLADYVDQMLAGTGIAPDAVLATAQGDAGTDALADRQVVEALRAGWIAADLMDTAGNGLAVEARDDTEERRT